MLTKNNRPVSDHIFRALSSIIEIHIYRLYTSVYLRSELMQLRTIAADWLNGLEPNDPALSGQKDGRPDDKVNLTPLDGVNPDERETKGG